MDKRTQRDLGRLVRSCEHKNGEELDCMCELKNEEFEPYLIPCKDMINKGLCPKVSSFLKEDQNGRRDSSDS